MYVVCVDTQVKMLLFWGWYAADPWLRNIVWIQWTETKSVNEEMNWIPLCSCVLLSCNNDNSFLSPQLHAWTVPTVTWFSTSCFVQSIASFSSTRATQVWLRLKPFFLIIDNELTSIFTLQVSKFRYTFANCEKYLRVSCPVSSYLKRQNTN